MTRGHRGSWGGTKKEVITLKLHVIARGAVAALLIGGASLGLAGPASAEGPIEDTINDVGEAVDGAQQTVLNAVNDACDNANCTERIAEIRQGAMEDLEYITSGRIFEDINCLTDPWC